MKKRTAFSLVELSIVLVILGLLVGGILAGQSLIRAAELRAITTEYNRYATAVSAFRDKYIAYPGDMGNAVTFWGAADGTTGNTAACATTQGTGTQTCNGNADGTLIVSTASDERARFWQHLANAGLIEGVYSGIVPSSLFTPGANIPASKIAGVGWGASNIGSTTGSTFIFDSNIGNSFNLFARPNTVGFLKPEEAWNIDTKMDDGKPGTGKVLAPWGTAYSGSATSCSTAASGADLTASYLLSNPNKDCGFWFTRIF